MAKEFVSICGNEYLLKKSKYSICKSPIHVSDGMTGKMQGIPSISTSCLVNPICQKRMQDGNSVCAHCFASATLVRFKDCGKNTAVNFRLLNESIISDELLPKFGNVSIARIESFGDVASVTQAINYADIIRVNPFVMFGWWSKNQSIIAKALDKVGKPKNLVLIESSPRLNVKAEKSTEYVDKTFTVYDDETIARLGIDINCGARCCATCRTCYSLETEDDIRERLK